MKTLLVALAAALTLTVGAQDPTPPPKDPALQQTVSAQEATASGPVEIGKGHVDIGPRLTGGQWRFLARDDTAHPPVWRDPADVVLRVHDSALLEIPADKQYEFLKAKPGKKVYVVPQTQNQSVLWLGWNTQDPAVTKAVDRGVTLVLKRYQGPGTFHVFLQNGFDAPDPLWDGSAASGQELWVDVNTHTHANWVFSEPGVYLVEIEARAKGVDGSALSSTGVLHFAVGDAVNAQEARAATFPAETSPGQNPSAAATTATATSTAPGTPATSQPARHDTGATPWVAVVSALVLLALVVGVALALVRGRRARAAAAREEGEDE